MEFQKTIKSQISSSLTGAMSVQQENIDIMSALYKYSWIFALVLSAIVMFLLSRRAVEYGYGGFT